jgi:putative DNA methylase
MNKKLIEVAIPLESINEASSREKSIRQGHPSTLHLWWARRPLASTRSIIFSQIVDDPSSHPELFPTEEDQNKERERLFELIRKMVLWENTDNEKLFNTINCEIKKYLNNDDVLLDPFAGGGSIPLEAQRLGIPAVATDLNPVAVMINKATIEIPFLFNNCPPVNPNTYLSGEFKGLRGLIHDIDYYGAQLKNLVFSKIGDAYPHSLDENGTQCTTVGWIWTRVIRCPNPLCGCEVPLSSTFSLSKSRKQHVEYSFNGKSIQFKVEKNGSTPSAAKISRGAKFKCLCCNEVIPDEYVKTEAQNNRMTSKMMAVIAEGKKGKIFLTPTESDINCSLIDKPTNYPDGQLSDDRRAIWCPLYGLDTFSKLFTNRQLLLLTTYTECIKEIVQMVERDALNKHLAADSIPLREGGSGARAYSEAIGVYLSFAIDRLANYSSTLNGWSGEFIIQTFGRQGLPMMWDYIESNPFSNSTGNWDGAISWITKVLEKILPNAKSIAYQYSATTPRKISYKPIVSTDPPYYDNIGYADLSDYFYIWMRSSIGHLYPDLFETMLVPKQEELIAAPYRFNGDMNKSKQFFENGMFEAFKQMYDYSSDDYPITIYYAFKQSESEEDDRGLLKRSSSGWETMLSALINAGFIITGTWPVRTERATGLKAYVNALASSIVLVCRKGQKKISATRREFINELRKELKPAIRKLQESNIAPVDLAQSSIGPGISVFSKYESILESDGSKMTVRTALQIINQELDAFVSEQEGELDPESRFCVNLFSQYAYNDVKYGEADVLARAKNTSVDRLSNLGALFSEKGIVRLKTREEIPEPTKSSVKTWVLCQQLTREVNRGGINATAKILLPYSGRDAENAKSLAYHLFTIADQKKWAQEAYAYNALISAWPDIQNVLMTLIGPEEKSGVTRIDRWLQ